MKFIYKPEKEKIIIEHESRMIEKYCEAIEKYSVAFDKYDCTIQIGWEWSNSSTGNRDEKRLPFKNGYNCYLYCNIQRNGETVRYEDEDGEVDYYEVMSEWNISFISRFFFKLNVTLYDNTDEIYEEMTRLLKIVESL